MDDPRSWARGKTAEELLNAGSQMYDGLNTLATMQTQQPYQTPRQQDDFAMPDDNDVVDGKTFKAALGAMQGTAYSTQQNQQQLAQMSLGMVRNQNAKVFGKYGPEIMVEINKLPVTMWTVDNLDMAVQLVRGRHIEELAEERARELAGNVTLSARSNGTAASDGLTLESDQLPPDYRDRLNKAGVTLDMVERFCVANNMTKAEWFKNAGRSAIGGN